MSTDGKMLVNTLYHGAVVTVFALSYARIGKMVFGGVYPKFDFSPRDVGMVVADVTLALASKDALIKQGIIPADIMK